MKERKRRSSAASAVFKTVVDIIVESRIPQRCRVPEALTEVIASHGLTSEAPGAGVFRSEKSGFSVGWVMVP